MWVTSTSTVSQSLPASVAWPDNAGTASAQTPVTSAAGPITSSSLLRSATAYARAASTVNTAVRSTPRPNSRPNRVASRADATGPLWLNACQNETPATSAPWRVSAIQAPPSASTAEIASRAFARCRSRSSASFRGVGGIWRAIGRNTATR